MTAKAPLHVGIIMDGNGRWATGRCKSRSDGHRAGADVARATVYAARAAGITHLTLYAFSSDNWQRPKGEVRSIFSLVRRFAENELDHLVAQGIRLTMIGRYDRIDASARAALRRAEAATRHCTEMLVRVAVDYSSRDVIAAAAGHLVKQGTAEPSRADFRAALAHVSHTANSGAPQVPDIDLLIRTGGEQRLSDFCLWELAYAELRFEEALWPDFTAQHLQTALDEFRQRERRYGAVPLAATAP